MTGGDAGVGDGPQVTVAPAVVVVVVVAVAVRHQRPMNWGATLCEGPPPFQRIGAIRPRGSEGRGIPA